MSDHRKRIRRQFKRAVTWSKSTAQPTNPQARILAGLNIMRVLEDHAPKCLQDVLVYGPGSFAGKGWASVLVWYRAKGYHSYRELTLFGVWAVEDEAQTRLLLGTKPLQFSASVYNPEAYNTLIKRGFKTYYGDDGSPPPMANVVYETSFNPTRRLQLRQKIADETVQWLKRRA